MDMLGLFGLWLALTGYISGAITHEPIFFGLGIGGNLMQIASIINMEINRRNRKN